MTVAVALGAAGASCLTASCSASDEGELTEEPAPGAVAPCSAGLVEGPDGACMPVGVQGCAALFIEDGFCRPSMDKCAPGTIPKFDEGCVSVGIPGCAQEFMADDGLCHPSMARCPTGTFAAPRRGCLTFSGPDACGTGAWGNIPDEPGNVYVDPGRDVEARDGSRERPLQTLDDALALVADGGRIALAAGTYGAPAAITRSIEIAGRCAALVTIQGLPDDPHATVAIDSAPGVTIRGVQIVGAGPGIVAADVPGLTLDRVHVRSARGFGVGVNGRRAGAATGITITRSWIEDTAQGAGYYGYGVWLQRAQLTLEDSAVTGAHVSAVFADGDDSAVTIAGSLIEGTLPDDIGLSESAVRVSAGAQAAIESSAVVGNRAIGLGVYGAMSSATATGSLIEGTLPEAATGDFGMGAEISRGAKATLTSSALLRNATAGVLASGRGTTAEITASLIQDTTAAEIDGHTSSGAVVLEGAQMSMRHSALWRNQSIGVAARDGRLDMTSCLVEDTALATDGIASGNGVAVFSSSASLISNAIVRNRFVGLNLDSGSDVTSTGNLIANTLPDARDGHAGRGVELGPGDSVSLVSDLITDNNEGSVLASGTDVAAASLTVDRCLVQRTASQELDETLGIGIIAQLATTRILSSIVRDHRVSGVLLLGSGTAAIANSRIHDVAAGTALGSDGVLREGLGDGVTVDGGTTVDLTEVRVSGCARAGLLYSSSSGSIASTHVSGNRFGLVISGTPAPTVDDESSFTDNIEQDQLRDGTLAVPDAPPRLP